MFKVRIVLSFDLDLLRALLKIMYMCNVKIVALTTTNRIHFYFKTLLEN